MARSLTPTEFVHREKAPQPRHLAHARGHDHLAAARAALSQLAHTLRHPRLPHLGH